VLDPLHFLLPVIHPPHTPHRPHTPPTGLTGTLEGCRHLYPVKPDNGIDRQLTGMTGDLTRRPARHRRRLRLRPLSRQQRQPIHSC
jgi:hypothetical protein